MKRVSKKSREKVRSRGKVRQNGKDKTVEEM